jgi:hypothetical protein
MNHFLTVCTERELDFERDMDNRDAQENARQEATDLRIDRLSPHQQATAEEQEERIRQAFDGDQRQRRHQHEAALAAAVRRVCAKLHWRWVRHYRPLRDGKLGLKCFRSSSARLVSRRVNLVRTPGLERVLSD